jgi:ketosteroid isomerase-like protein
MTLPPPRDTARAVSQENVELVHQCFAAYDEGGLDALAEFWHPEISWRAVEGYLDDVGVMRGKDALRAYVQDWLDTFDETRTEIEELTDAGEQVVAAVRGIGRMRGSDAEVDIRYGIVFWIRDRKIVQGREYATGKEASQPPGCGSRPGISFLDPRASGTGS